jgi:hypothetical protein
VVFRGVHQVARWNEHTSKVTLLLEFGQQILSIDAGRRLCVWEPSKAAAPPEQDVLPVRE